MCKMSCATHDAVPEPGVWKGGCVLARIGPLAGMAAKAPDGVIGPGGMIGPESRVGGAIAVRFGCEWRSATGSGAVGGGSYAGGSVGYDFAFHSLECDSSRRSPSPRGRSRIVRAGSSAAAAGGAATSATGGGAASAGTSSLPVPFVFEIVLSRGTIGLSRPGKLLSQGSLISPNMSRMKRPSAIVDSDMRALTANASIASSSAPALW